MGDHNKEGATPDVLPQTAEDYSRRGWFHLSAQETESAVSDFKTAVSMNSGLVEAVYGLGMALNADNQGQEAIKAFDQAIALLDNGAFEDNARAEMFRRIIRAQRTFAGTEPSRTSA